MCKIGVVHWLGSSEFTLIQTSGDVLSSFRQAQRVQNNEGKSSSRYRVEKNVNGLGLRFTSGGEFIERSGSKCEENFCRIDTGQPIGALFIKSK